MKKIWDFSSIRRFRSRWEQRGVWGVWDPYLGDGGKAKVVDALTACPNVAAVVRHQGGDNSGHTVVVNGKKIAVHIIPCGVIRSQERPLTSVIGRGVVASLQRLFAEIDKLGKNGIAITPDNLLISKGTQLTLAYHMALELAREQSKGKMDTTAKAISQTYGLARFYQGVRAGDVQNLDRVRQQIQMPLAYVNAILKTVYGYRKNRLVSEDDVMAEVKDYRDRLLPFLGDEAKFLNDLLLQGKVVVCEGAQSLLLDVDLGIYPFTTASNTCLAAIQHGCGIDPRWITRSIAVAKAYLSRVGQGVFPSEIESELAQTIRERGGEYGTTTGRPRRILWNDWVMSGVSRLVSPPTELAITKVDILTGIDPLLICVAYQKGQQRVNSFPIIAAELASYQPVLKKQPGWKKDITGVTHWDDLPKGTQAYLLKVARPFGCPISMIGTGPGREQLIVMDPPLEIK